VIRTVADLIEALKQLPLNAIPLVVCDNQYLVIDEAALIVGTRQVLITPGTVFQPGR
jgi:hypothetical protein